MMMMLSRQQFISLQNPNGIFSKIRNYQNHWQYTRFITLEKMVLSYTILFYIYSNVSRACDVRKPFMFHVKHKKKVFVKQCICLKINMFCHLDAEVWAKNMYKKNIDCKYDKSVCYYLFWKWFDIINGPFSNIYFPLILFPFQFWNGLIFHFEIFDAVFLFGRFKTFCRRILLDLLSVNSTINIFSKVSYYTHWPRFEHNRKSSKQCMYRNMSQWYRP